MKLAPKLALPFVLSLSFAWLQFATVAHAQEHRGEEHHDVHGGGDIRPRPRAPRRRSSRPTRRASTRTVRWCDRTPSA